MKCYECKYEHSDCKGNHEDDCANFAKRGAFNYHAKIRELESSLKQADEAYDIQGKQLLKALDQIGELNNENEKLKADNFRLDNEWNELREKDEKLLADYDADAKAYDAQGKLLFEAQDRIKKLEADLEMQKNMRAVWKNRAWQEGEARFELFKENTELKAENEKFKEENKDLRFETVRAFERGQKFPCDLNCDNCTEKCRAWQNGYNAKEHELLEQSVYLLKRIAEEKPYINIPKNNGETKLNPMMTKLECDAE